MVYEQGLVVDGTEHEVISLHNKQRGCQSVPGEHHSFICPLEYALHCKLWPPNTCCYWDHLDAARGLIVSYVPINPWGYSTLYTYVCSSAAIGSLWLESHPNWVSTKCEWLASDTQSQTFIFLLLHHTGNIPRYCRYSLNLTSWPHWPKWLLPLTHTCACIYTFFMYVYSSLHVYTHDLYYSIYTVIHWVHT